jgi:hypothetical protein
VVHQSSACTRISSVVYSGSILFQNGTLIRPASTRFVIDCSRTPVRGIDLQVGVYGGGWIMEEAGSGHEDSSHNIPTLDACRFCLGSQVTPGVVNVHADTADM